MLNTSTVSELLKLYQFQLDSIQLLFSMELEHSLRQPSAERTQAVRSEAKRVLAVWGCMIRTIELLRHMNEINSFFTIDYEKFKSKNEMLIKGCTSVMDMKKATVQPNIDIPIH